MAERREEVDCLRRKSAQFRKLAVEHGTPLSAKLIEVAEAMEEHAAALEARAAPRTAPLISYRVYFRTSRGAMAGRDEFPAEDDWSALMIASELCNACSDLCQSFELWDGARRVDSEARQRRELTPTGISRQAQETLIEHEMMLRDSNWLVAKSKRLLERIREVGELRPD